jgi:hypothetical protein
MEKEVNIDHEAVDRSCHKITRLWRWIKYCCLVREWNAASLRMKLPNARRRVG